MGSTVLRKKSLCIFLVGFIIDPGAEALGTTFKNSIFPLEHFLLPGLERVKVVDSLSPCFIGDFPESVTDDRYVTSECEDP